MSSPAPSNAHPPGSTYRLVVSSAQEAVETIRRELGPTARVLSVRTLPGTGWRGLFGKPQIEVVAELPEPPVETPAANRSEFRPAGTFGDQLRERLSETTPTAAANDFLARREAPMGRSLPEVLRRGGFSDLMMARLQANPRWTEIEQRPLHEALSEIGRELRAEVTRPTRRALTDRVAFLGLAGTGRTTALCKWLAHSTFQLGQRGSVAKVEFDRPNPADGLAVFCEALGVGLNHVDGTAPLPTQPAQDFLLADLPSVRLGGRTDENLRRFLDDNRFTSRVLVLHALHDRAALQAAYAMGRTLGATHLIFTHVDELAHWGKLWDYLLEGAVTPLFLGVGPSLVGELETEAVDTLLRRTIPGA